MSRISIPILADEEYGRKKLLIKRERKLRKIGVFENLKIFLMVNNKHSKMAKILLSKNLKTTNKSNSESDMILRDNKNL